MTHTVNITKELNTRVAGCFSILISIIVSVPIAILSSKDIHWPCAS